MPAHDQVLGEPTLRIQRHIGLGDVIAPLLHGRQVHHLVRDPAVLDLAIRRFDKAVFIHPREGGKRVDEADIGTFGRLDRANPTIVGRMHVAHLEARALAGKTARTKRREPPLMGDFGQRVGLIHELRQLRRAEKLPHGRRGRLGVDQILRHHGVDIDRPHPLLDGTLHAQQADPVLILHQLADRPHPAIAEMVDVVDFTLAVAQIDQGTDHRDDVLLAQHAQRVLRLHIEAHIHLDAADRGQIVALRIEEQRLEHRLGGIEGRRFTRTHYPVNVEQGVFARHVLVDIEGVANIGADIDVVDVEDRNFRVAGLVQRFEHLIGNLGAGFRVDFTGLRIDQIFCQIVTDQLVVGHPQRFETFLGELARLPHGYLLAGLDHHRTGIGIDQIVDCLIAAHPVRIERHPPTVLRPLVKDLLVEGVEDLLAIHAEREHQRRHRNLPAAIDARIYDVLGVELDVEPRPAIGNDSRRKQELARRMGLALVVIEEHTGGAVHLRHDHALGAVDDEGAIVGHERYVAHVHVLLLDVLDRACRGFLIDVEHDQPQRHLERRRIRHPALAALVNVVFRRLELVAHELQLRDVREIGDREHRLEYRLQAFVGAPALGLLDKQKLIVGCLLNLNEVRHLCDFFDFSKELAYPFATGERLCHRGLFLPPPAVMGQRGPPAGAKSRSGRWSGRREYPFRRL